MHVEVILIYTFFVYRGEGMVKKDVVEEILGSIYNELIGFTMKYVGVRADAEDLVQDTLLKIWEYTEKIKTLSTIRGLIYKTLRNKIVDFMRKNKYPKIPIEKIVVYTTDNTYEEDDFNVWTYVDMLPENERKLIYLRFKEGKSIAEVAEILGRSIAAVKSIQYRAIRRLRELMEK